MEENININIINTIVAIIKKFSENSNKRTNKDVRYILEKCKPTLCLGGVIKMKRGFITIKTSLFFLLVFCLLAAQGQASDILETISPRQAADLISQKKGDNGFVILDVRTTAEFEIGRLHNAVLLDYYSKDFINELDRLDKTKTYLIYCRSGNRSGKTLHLIENMGFKEVYNMAQGIIGWRKNGFPVTQ